MIDAQVRELLPQPSVAIRIQAPMADLDLGSLFDQHLPNIAQVIHRLALHCNQPITALKLLRFRRQRMIHSHRSHG